MKNIPTTTLIAQPTPDSFTEKMPILEAAIKDGKTYTEWKQEQQKQNEENDENEP